jgi:hypothetical protein
MSSSLEQVFIRFHVKQNKNLRLTIMVATSPSLFPSLPVHTSKKRKKKKKHYTQTNYIIIIIIIMIIYIYKNLKRSCRVTTFQFSDTI